MSEIVAISPKLQAAMQKIYNNSKKQAMDSYLDMVRSLSRLPEEQLVDGALTLARDRANGQDIGSDFGNHWLQALSIKNPAAALIVNEMIENGDYPDDRSASE